jgi:hypothetical protein
MPIPIVTIPRAALARIVVCTPVRPLNSRAKADNPTAASHSTLTLTAGTAQC